MAGSSTPTRVWQMALVAAVGAVVSGCGAGVGSSGTKTDTAAKRTYESAGGTSGLDMGTGDAGAAVLSSFDPGAFARTTSTPDEETINPADHDATGSEPPPPPPPDDSTTTSEPPPPPPPDDGTTTSEPPPPDGSEPLPPPDDGTTTSEPPPPDGTEPPPPDGSEPPPPDGSEPPPPDGEYFPPPDGELLPPPDGEYLPPPEDFDSTGTYTIEPPPDGYVGDGGFYAPPEGFDEDGIFFVPPEGFEGDAVYLPPPPDDFTGDGFYFPPPDGSFDGEGFEAPADFFDVYADFPPPPPDFEGDWQPPPPDEWSGASDWVSPPPDQLYADGAWYPPPPPLGWEGDWFPPPPPPEGIELFPPGMFFSDKFDEFFTPELFDAEGFVDGPPPFEEFPFEAFFAEHSLHDIIPDAPPEFFPGAFGEFRFGELPPPPPGFLPFPPPPVFVNKDGEFGFVFDFDAERPEDFVPPDGLPEEFFAHDAIVDDFKAFIEGFDFPIPPGEPGGDPSGLGFVPFEDIAALLPDDFLLPAEVATLFESFGMNHPLIGEDGTVNPDLEQAFVDHPPLPEGFDGFDFEGDCPQFDDLFTMYHADTAGETMRGQVMTTFTDRLDDGSTVTCSETTLLEVVQGEATPLVQMEPGVFQTQWVVNIRQQTSAEFLIQVPGDPTADIQASQAREILSQMTWTMVMREIDTDGDGIPDEIQVSGSNVTVILSETFDGELPPGLPPLPPAPELLLDLDFQGVLDLQPPPATPGTQ